MGTLGGGGWDAGLQASGRQVAKVFSWNDFCSFGVLFFAGSTLAAYAVQPRWWMAAMAVWALWGALVLEPVLLRQAAVWVLVVLGIFYMAHVRLGSAGDNTVNATSTHDAGRGRIDLSYGVYIYAFPIQQAVTALCLEQNWSWTVCLLLSLVAIVLLAGLSWFGVERPCMRAAQEWLRQRVGP